MAQQAVEKVGFDKHNLARTGRMALYGGGIFPFPLPFLPHPSFESDEFVADIVSYNSYIRPRSHDMVRLPRSTHQLPLPPQPHNSSTRAHRPDRLRLCESGVFPD